MGKQNISRGVRFGVITALLSLSLACSPLIKNHGYIPEEEDLARVIVGQDTRESVTSIVGPPTSGGVLNGSGYYYVQSKFRTLGVFAPEEIEREVVAISFNDAGVVTNIERFGLEDGQVVTLSRRVTDNGIKDSTFIRQLLGSIGRFDAGQFLGQN